MKLPPTPNQRIATALRQVTPAHAGGRTNLVAPTPTMPSAGTTATDAGPLPPWGVEGAATLHAAPWYGVYADAASAAAHTGSSMQFGLYNGDAAGIDFMVDTTTATAGRVAMEAGATEAVILADMGAHGSFFVSVTPTVSTVQLIDGAQSSAVTIISDAGVATTDVTATGDHIITHVQNDGTSEYSWIEISQSVTAVPNAAAARGRLFVKDNGFGKQQLCVRFPSGAAIVLATEP